MSRDDYSRLEHLKMVQGAIGRMAQNSFVLKGWSVTLVTAMMALAVSDKNRGYAALALFPALARWGRPLAQTGESTQSVETLPALRLGSIWLRHTLRHLLRRLRQD